jgi:Uma2 family endonuclease
MRTNTCLRTLADALAEEHFVEFVDDGVLMITLPTGFTHGSIIAQIDKALAHAARRTAGSTGWDVRRMSFQFDLVDDPRKFFVPDLAVARPGSTNDREFRENLAMVVEVTSPGAPETVENDHGVKPKQYAKARLPCYLLVDQQQATWTVYVLEDDWPGYLIHSRGGYGAPIELPEPFGFTIPTSEWPAYREDD